ncbi:XRE family transcriptional regulator [Kribbella antibiotica]|uniref:XRE family transcriptional regulator n=1 Tax=Kribbella antibiotica TaxID=190195 RepID=A0A4R4ZK89_9ACTN|nr:helix-turn-helix transcriptional regulator [Kribbella antibiotica]TDD58214.1 XRE family transcriptional regulator [Kribbella antibiotica]
MTQARSGSTVPRRQLGRQLRELRNQARMTAKAAAQAMDFSEAKLFRMEAGDVPMRSLEVERMCQIYGAPDDLTQAMAALARETKSKGWWHSYLDVVSENAAVYVGLESAASDLSAYQTDLIDGLFQTEAYARAVIAASHPEAELLTAERIDRITEMRLARRILLTRPTAPLAVRAVLGEAALRRPIGGRKAMAEQLDHLLELSELSNVEIRVVPLEASNHRGVGSGSFSILCYPSNGSGRLAEPPTVYVEGFLGMLYLDKPQEIERYEAAWTDIWAAALDVKSSQNFITKIGKELA